MRIGIDLDEVLAEFMPALIEYHNATFGTSFVIEQFKSYNLWETWGGTREESIQKVYDFYRTPEFRNIRPIAHSQEAVRTLRQNNDLLIVTSRPDEAANTTKEWMSQHFPNVFSDIFFTNHKRQICDAQGIDVMIEDCLEYALDCVQPERRVLLLDCPWNQTPSLPKGVYRVHSWKDIVASVLR